ncbi:hypothetical protein AAG570_001633 [Ranatra chinensis]|uniref:VASt domain-containing protein n=1 Tax=Ranatra chinensis TaxID=642074 RepID=A0ABD0YVM5_9HEMI
MFHKNKTQETTEKACLHKNLKRYPVFEATVLSALRCEFVGTALISEFERKSGSVWNDWMKLGPHIRDDYDAPCDEIWDPDSTAEDLFGPTNSEQETTDHSKYTFIHDAFQNSEKFSYFPLRDNYNLIIRESKLTITNSVIVISGWVRYARVTFESNLVERHGPIKLYRYMQRIECPRGNKNTIAKYRFLYGECWTRGVRRGDEGPVRGLGGNSREEEQKRVEKKRKRTRRETTEKKSGREGAKRGRRVEEETCASDRTGSRVTTADLLGACTAYSCLHRLEQPAPDTTRKLNR